MTHFQSVKVDQQVQSGMLGRLSEWAAQYDLGCATQDLDRTGIQNRY
jgi:hypothetical protein